MNERKIKIKVCGMRDPLNADELVRLRPDYMGFIFYPPSKRYVRDIANGEALNFIPKHIKKTGVFVNATIHKIKEAIEEYQLNAIQLHGDETPAFCSDIQALGQEVFKAFQVDDHFDFSVLTPYTNVCDYFLLDTQSKGYGGSGKKFNWDILEGYKMDKPFILSGGIQPGDAATIKDMQHKSLYAVDINSGFEDAPGLKNMGQVKTFMGNLNAEQ